MPASPPETLLCLYHYDPLDRQTGCMLSARPALQRFYCKSRLATEIEGALSTSVFQHDDQLLAQQQHDDEGIDSTLLATDQQRSVLNALQLTDPRSLAYTAYGHRPVEDSLLSLLGFNGERLDPVTGHYHLGNGYRQFNPVLMRFNSPDSWSPFGEGGLNAYVYGKGDPANSTDPSGHIPGFLKKIFKTSKNVKTPKLDQTKNVSAVLSSSTKNQTQILGQTPPLKPSLPQGHELNGLTPSEQNIKLNQRYKMQPQKLINPPHKGKHFPPQPSPSAYDGVDTESYKKFASYDQLYSDHVNNSAILEALKNEPSTSKALQNFAITQDAINIRFAQ